MGKELSRRTLLRGAAVTAIAAPTLLPAQTNGSDEADLARRLTNAEKQLAAPLPADVRKLTSEALKGVDRATTTRLKTKVAENSEPCFIFVPTEKGK